VIINAYPSLRAHLTGTKYLANNPKVVSIGVGKLSANSAIKGGFVVSLIISVTFNALDQLLNDNATWHTFVAGVAVDMAVVGAAIVTAEILINLGAAIGGTVIAGSALFPLAIVVGVGVVFAYTFQDTSPYVKSLVVELQELEQKLKNNVIQIRGQVKKIEKDYQEDPYGFMSRSFGIPVLNFGQKKKYK